MIDPLIDADEWRFDDKYRLRDMADKVLETIRKALPSLDLDDIREQARQYGANINEWRLTQAEKEALVKALAAQAAEEEGLNPSSLSPDKAFKLAKGRLLWLTTYLNGVERSVWDGVKGLDALSLGIPHPPLVKLLKDLPRLAFLMREDNPDSALALIDGTAGARGPVLDKEMVKLWLALGGTYTAVAVSDQAVEKWRREMMEEAEKAGRLLAQILQGDLEKAGETLRQLIPDDARLEEIRWLSQGARLGTDAARHQLHGQYTAILRSMEKIRLNPSLKNLGFTDWLALGGRLHLARQAHRFRSYREFRAWILDVKRRYEEALDLPPEPDEQALALIAPGAEEEKIELVLGGSLKAEARDEWESLQRRVIRARQARARRLEKIRATASSFTQAYREARKALGPPRPQVDEEAYTRLLAYTAEALKHLTRELMGGEAAAELEKWLADNLLKQGGISIRAYSQLLDRLTRLAAACRGDKQLLEKVAMAAELVDTCLAVELVEGAQGWRERWTAIATFFDRSLNNHIFDYAPYLYTRAAFSKDPQYRDVYTRKELFQLIARRYSWLHQYLTLVIRERTQLKYWPPEKVKLLLTMGTDRDDLAQAQGYPEASRLVFSYARLRDLATLVHDGFPIPDVLDIDPAALGMDAKPTVVILYNLGNTTAMTFLRRGPSHPDKNVIMTNFLRKAEHPSGHQVALVDYGLIYLTEQQYRRAGGSSPDAGRDGDTRLVFARFTKPLTAAAVFPHFTHPWFTTQTLEEMGVPLNQSRIIDRLTYEKTILPEMIEHYNRQAQDKIEFIHQVNIYREQAAKLTPRQRRRLVEQTLLEFSRKHPVAIIKTSTESGGRGTIIARLRNPDGSINEKAEKAPDGSTAYHGFTAAVEFILNEILPKDDAVIQEFIPSNPRQILTPEAYRQVVARFRSLGINIGDNTPLYWNFRNYVVWPPGEEPRVTGWIMLVHVKGIANYGQGGQLFILKKDMFKPEYRHLIDEMERVSKATMKMMMLYAPIHAARRGIKILRDLTGTPYSRPMTNLSDLMLKPVDTGGATEWRVVPIEENIGMGLFYQYERLLAAEGRAGESVDPILDSLAKAARQYLQVLNQA